MPKPEDNQKAGTPATPAEQPKGPPAQGTDEAPVHTEPDKPNDEAFDPRVPG